MAAVFGADDGGIAVVVGDAGHLALQGGGVLVYPFQFQGHALLKAFLGLGHIGQGLLHYGLFAVPDTAGHNHCHLVGGGLRLLSLRRLFSCAGAQNQGRRHEDESANTHSGPPFPKRFSDIAPPAFCNLPAEACSYKPFPSSPRRSGGCTGCPHGRWKGRSLHGRASFPP